MARTVYLDNHATTQIDRRVLQAMLPYFTEYYGNGSNSSHSYGLEAQSAIKAARTALAKEINCTPEEIIFTSGATEANNLAIKGFAEANHHRGRHIITVITEHSAVLDPCNYLASLGFEITYLPVDSFGLVDVELFEQSIRTDTILASVMLANNEIGVYQPIHEIAEICQRTGVTLHSDAAQAIGKISIDVQKLPLGMMSMTAHKIHGPKGVGALFVRKQPKVVIAPQLHGGGQERGLRSGTIYTPQVVGFAKAIQIAQEERRSDMERILNLRERLWHRLKQLPGIYLNGHPTKRLAGNLNVSVEGVDGNALHLELRSLVAVSSGSACSEGKVSHVLLAIGRSERLAGASLRFGLGRFNTTEEIEMVAEQVSAVIKNLQKKGRVGF